MFLGILLVFYLKSPRDFRHNKFPRLRKAKSQTCLVGMIFYSKDIALKENS